MLILLQTVAVLHWIIPEASTFSKHWAGAPFDLPPRAIHLKLLLSCFHNSVPLNVRLRVILIRSGTKPQFFIFPSWSCLQRLQLRLTGLNFQRPIIIGMKSPQPDFKNLCSHAQSRVFQTQKSEILLWARLHRLLLKLKIAFKGKLTHAACTKKRAYIRIHIDFSLRAVAWQWCEHSFRYRHSLLGRCFSISVVSL